MSKNETVPIRFSAEIKGKLEAIASSTNRSKSWLAAQAIASYVEEQAWQVQPIEEAVMLADSDRAVWTEGAEVDSWLAFRGRRVTRTLCHSCSFLQR